MRFNPAIRPDLDYEGLIAVYKNFLIEVNMLSHSNHRNISRMIQAMRNKLGNLFIIMEFFEDGNLYVMRARDLGEDEKNYYQEDKVIEIFRQICEGVSYIHGKGAAHRDLDPNNIMI